MNSAKDRPGILAAVIAIAAIALCCFGTLILAGVGAAGVSAFTHSLRYVLPTVFLLLALVGFLAYRKWKKT